MKRPNVLLLYTDQQRWDSIGASGLQPCLTPNLDALAAKGALFDHCFVNAPVCMPSRQSMLAGRYPSSVGTVCNGVEMDPAVSCIHNVIGQYGYHTAQLGKLHFKNHAHRDHREPHPDYGFDTFILSDEPGCYQDAYLKWVAERDPSAVEACMCDTPPMCTMPKRHKQERNTTDPYVFEGPEDLSHTAFVADETCDFIKRHKDGEPWFAIAGFYAPHCPLNPPQRFIDMYDIDAMKLPNRLSGQGSNLNDDEWRKVVAYYWALCSHVDDQVGRILATLEECGLSDDTLVIFTSDHGEYLGDQGRIQKGGPHDPSARVPLIVSYPKAIEPGQRRSEIIEHVDLAPTILDWAGIQKPPIMQGHSFRPLLQPGRGDYSERDSAYMEIKYPFGAAYKALRTKDYLYHMWNDGRDLLYDLASDPYQLTDVAKDPAQVDALQKCRHRLLERWFDVENQYPIRVGDY
ncbi:MAG: sulfatase-like hydrolase/transferase [Planctomycetota bacterium]|jgi:arylsulfatase|nr:sulfatase-like hydrolase/transferase [Planctomycetota bacterium]